MTLFTVLYDKRNSFQNFIFHARQSSALHRAASGVKPEVDKVVSLLITDLIGQVYFFLAVGDNLLFKLSSVLV